MGDTLVRTDKNGTQYWTTDICPKCGGTGYIPGYSFIQNGVCFKCNGTGKSTYSWKVYTPEYRKLLNERRLEKARKEAPEKNKKYMLSEGFSEEGVAYIVLGDTYEIKDTLKEQGARWNPTLGWHFNREMPNTFPVKFEDLTTEQGDGLRRYDQAYEKVEEMKAAWEKKLNPVTSQHVGVVGEKISLVLTYIDTFSYETHISYYGETHWIHKFEDENHNIFIWNTTSYSTRFEAGKSYKVQATIKQHSSYKEVPQTELTRLKVLD